MHNNNLVVGVVVVAFNTGPILIDCIMGLLASEGVDLRIVIVDNASTDDTIEVLLASELGGVINDCNGHPRQVEGGRPVLLRSKSNGGFASGVNQGLELLLGQEEVDFFWIVNPDTIIPPTTASALVDAARSNPDFGVMGGRICYFSEPNTIQNDGGRVSLWTGVCRPVNMLCDARSTSLPDASSLDYVCAAHIAVSRTFIAQAGLMPERYFLYYEEAEWCLKRGRLPIVFVEDAVVYHHGGTAIGSATIDRQASPLSTYYMARSRLIFIRRHRAYALPIAFLHNIAKAARLILRGNRAGGISSLRGSLGLPPPKALGRKHGIVGSSDEIELSPADDTQDHGERVC